MLPKFLPLVFLMGGVALAGCSGSDESGPSPKTCGFNEDDEAGCRARPEASELAAAWPELRIALHELAVEVRAAKLRGVHDQGRLSTLAGPGLPPFPYEGFGRQGALAVGVAEQEDAAAVALVRTAMSLFVENPFARQDAVGAFVLMSPRGRNRFQQIEPRGRLYPALYAASMALIIEHHVGTRVGWDTFARQARAFVEERLLWLRAQQRELAPRAAEAEIDRAVEALGATELRDIMQAWTELGPSSGM